MRIYQVKDGKLDEWTSQWRTKIAPLLEEFGFHIDGAWTVPGANQFAYLITYDGPEDFDVRNQEYAKSHERAALGVDPEEYVESIKKFPLKPI